VKHEPNDLYAHALESGVNIARIFMSLHITLCLQYSDNAVPDLPQSRGGMGSMAVCNGRVYVIGGETNADPNVSHVAAVASSSLY
jgi:hypothetical protein